MIYINITISVALKVGGGATLKIRNLHKQKKKGYYGYVIVRLILNNS